ncbi:MAG: ribonuclease H-like domain-containing protein [Nitrospinaceae bacterium]
MSEQFDLFADPPVPGPPAQPKNGPRILYFDLETQKSAGDVGGWGNSHLMLLAVGVVWDSLEEDYFVFRESQAQDLVQKIVGAQLVVGYNVQKFDYSVLQPYANPLGVDLQEIPTFDMLVDIHKRLNHRLPLDNLARCTLGEAKSADGLQSLQWFKEGKFDKIIEYCKQDVKVTRDLFLFGEKNGYVEYENRNGARQRLAVNWNSVQLDQAPNP